jgi:malonyl-CoA O-methyltransferase
MLKKLFNKAHYTYDNEARLQKTVGDQLFEIIQHKSSQYQNIIDIGCGTGYVTKRFAERLQYQSFHALDIADNLLNLAKTRLKNFPIQFLEKDFRLFQSKLSFDLIYSNMALHWSENMTDVIANLLTSLKKNGLLAFSIPLAGTFKEISSYVNTIDFIDQEKILNEWQVSFYETQKIVLEFPSMLQALQSIKKIGANYTGKNRKGLHNNPFLKKILLNPSHDSTTLTYHIGYFFLES